MEPDELVYPLPDGSALYFRRPDDAGALALVRGLVVLMVERWPKPQAHRAVVAFWAQLAALAIVPDEITAATAGAVRAGASGAEAVLFADTDDRALWLIAMVRDAPARHQVGLVCLLAGLHSGLVSLMRFDPLKAEAALAA